MTDEKNDKPETDSVETESVENGTQPMLSDPSGVAAPAHLEGDAIAAELGVTRYVHAAFFGAAILIGFLSGKLLLSAWNALAEWPAAAEFLPSLLNYDEDKRTLSTVLLGAAIGLFAVIYAYRKDGVRRWADEVATELAKVTWPSKEAVQNGMIVVLVAGAIFTAYIAILDRFWGFLTTLVYGA